MWINNWSRYILFNLHTCLCYITNKQYYFVFYHIPLIFSPGDIAFRFMDYRPLGKREVTICDLNAKMLRHGQKKAAKQGYTRGKLIIDIC